MTLATARAWLPIDSRRVVRMDEPAAQLRLPLVLLAVTLGFGLLFAWHTQAAYGALFAMLLANAPIGAADMIREQTQIYLMVSCVLGAGWMLVVGCICVAYTHSLIGPLVALRRQIHALRRGHYDSRVRLRGRDPVYSAVAEELNELTRQLAQRGEASSRASAPPQRPVDLPWEGRL